MATGFAPAIAQAILNAYANGTDWSGLEDHWIQLHVGDPGDDGTSAVAQETTRVQASFGTAHATNGTVANDAAVTWENVAADEEYTHFSDWSASTNGTFQGSGTISNGAVTAGTDFTAEIGDLVLSLNVAADEA
jgi:hypothetical protein